MSDIDVLHPPGSGCPNFVCISITLEPVELAFYFAPEQQQSLMRQTILLNFAPRQLPTSAHWRCIRVYGTYVHADPVRVCR